MSHPLVSYADLTQNAPPHQGAFPIVGIWRLGESFHAGNWASVSVCQPADSRGSPRFDYVIKQANDSTLQARGQITGHVAAATEAVHPNVAPVLDASVEGSKPYLIMPRLEGQTMSWYLTKSPATDLPVALWFVRQMAQGLEAMHRAGWIHGDIKPDNVLVNSQGHVTLIDLGFATKIHTVSPNQFRGTHDYASPESLSGQYAAMPAMDLFSLGRVLWQWLTKTNPVAAVYLDPVADLVEKMISASSEDRPTATEVIKTLLHLEIESLGRHIGPSPKASESRRAA